MVADIMTVFLAENKEIEKKIRTDKPPSEEDLEKIGAALGAGLEARSPKPGLQFIEGFLVYVEEPPSE